MPQQINTGFSPVGAALTQPTLPAQTPGGTGVPGANMDPSLWQKFLSSMKNDPNFQQSLMVTGLNLLGSPQPGESGFGTFSRSALSGVQTLDRLRARDREEERRQEQIDIQKAGQTDSVRRTDESIRRGDIAERTADVNAAVEGAQLAQGTARLEILRETNKIRATEAQNRKASSAASGVGVQQQMVKFLAENLVAANPERYEGDQGLARARIDAATLQPENADRAQDRLLKVVELLRPIQGYETEEQFQQSMDFAREVLNVPGIGEAEVETPEIDPLDGKVTSQGTLIKQPDGQFVIDVGGQLKGPFDKATAQRFADGS